MLGSYEIIHTMGTLQDGSGHTSHVAATYPYGHTRRPLCGIPVDHAHEQPLRLEDVTCLECRARFDRGDWMIIATSPAVQRPVYMGHLGHSAMNLFLGFCRSMPEMSLRITRNGITVASRCGKAETADLLSKGRRK